MNSASSCPADQLAFEREQVWLKHLPRMIAPWCVPDKPVAPEAVREIVNTVLISIIIPCYNQIEYTRLCLKNIFQYSRPPFELIMVDNGSHDGTTEYLRALAHKKPEVRVIHNPVNLGYAVACNQGLAAATGEFMVVMNNDILVSERWLEGLVGPAAEHPYFGIVGPRTNYVTGCQLVRDVPYGEDDFEGFHRFAEECRERNRGKGFFAAVAFGFCLLLRRDLLNKIGGFDPRFGLGNFEDADLCFRALSAGYNVWISDEVFVHHFGSRSFTGNKIDFSELMIRNHRRFVAKWRLPTRANFQRALDLRDILRRPFDPASDYEPLTLEELVKLSAGSLRPAEERHFHFIALPDWEDPQDRWPGLLESFCTVFSAKDDVALFLRVDPVGSVSLEEAVARLELEADRRGLDLEGGPLVVILDDPVPSPQRLKVFSVADVVVDSCGNPGRSYLLREEARACGLPVIDPGKKELLEMYRSGICRRSKLCTSRERCWSAMKPTGT